ncbi:DNA helicase [Tanacetum coccineum]
MKGKRKCHYLNDGPNLFNNTIGHDIWNGDYGSTSARQQCWRRILHNGSARHDNDDRHYSANESRYMDVGTSHISGYAEGSIILDFADPTRHSFAEQQDYGDVDKFRCNGPRYSRDYTYEFLFRQTGSVSTQGESSTNKFGSDKPLRPTADSVQTFSCDMQDNPTSYLEGRPMGDEYSRRNTNNRGPVILDFENSVVQSPSVMPASSGESSRTSFNGMEHLRPTADSKGPVILDFQNQAVHLASTMGVSTGFQIANDVDTLGRQNNYPPNIDNLDNALFGGMSSIDSNGQHSAPTVASKPTQISKNVDSRKRHNIKGPLLSNVASASNRPYVNLNCQGANSDVASKRKSTICREPLPNVTSQGVSSFYIDIGDCEYSCQHCGAKFWYGERLQRSSTYQVLNYHKCCLGGKVRLGTEPHPPDYIRLLFKNRRFMENIRAYNQMFSMTSFGARVEDSINNGRAPYVFKISGEVYHWIGSLCPNEGDPPRFLQLYIYDTKNEVANRMRHFGGIGSGNLEEAIVEGLINFLDEHNELVRLFRTTRDKCAGQFVPDFKLRLYSVVGAREYDLPTSETLGGIVFQNGQDTETDYDVIIQSRGGPPQRINKLHPSYMSLQFPLLFIFGQPGFHKDIKQSGRRETKRVSMNMFYMYQLHERLNSYGLLFRGGRLFQQYVVGVYCCIEQNRMDYYRTHQSDIRKDYLAGVYDAISRGDREGRFIGSKIILPMSFTGGPRYMYSHYLDALAICRALGNPQFFVTFTCNVNWPEIKRHMQDYPEVLPGDRADVVVRVFHQKVQNFCKFLKDRRLFGTVTGLLYTIEFQKRGLPHCHTLLWIDEKDKIQCAEDIDRYISAELPDPIEDPEGYRIISEMMIHGPCGPLETTAPCMKENKCSKKFPKRYNESTYFDKDGYAHYRRRQTNVYTTRHGADLDNCYTVPYNRELCLTFHAHINVEYCGWTMLIKYLFKYISKGTDRILAQITRPVGDSSSQADRENTQVDEIQNFVDGRYICPHEAFWRILKFEIHSRQPAVQILSVHLENMQVVTFRDHQPLEFVANNETRKMTTLTEWFEYNKFNTDGRHLTYLDFPKYFVWYADSKVWSPRRRAGQGSIGRLAHVHPSAGELFYLRILLCHQKGCKSFEDIRTVNDIVYVTFRAACEALGLLGDDKEWDTALMEACFSSTSTELRNLFVQLLIFCEVSDPTTLWRKYWRRMSDDIPLRVSKEHHISNLHINDPELEQYVLFELEIILKAYSKTVTDFGLPPLSTRLLHELRNRELMEERSYNRDELTQEMNVLVPKLNSDQRRTYDLIVNAVSTGQQELIFVYGHGGTGKTFLWKTVITTLRSQGKIVLAVASSGIASLLLPNGRTSHSRFKLPLELTDESICKITKNTHAGHLLAKTDLIIWDESPMNDRRCFETLDRTLKDIMDSPERLFGGKTVVLGGDFRQTLPVKKGASKLEIIASSIVESHLWNHFNVCILKENMRLLQPGKNEAEQRLACSFASWLLDIGNGKIGEPAADDIQNSFWITVPQRYCIPDDNNGLSNLINFIYDKGTLQHPTAQELQHKAISSDEAVPLGNDRGATKLLYPMEYLNTLQFSGFPPHELELKVGIPIMLLRNLNLQGGMCNGTRMIIKKLWSKLIEAEGNAIQANMGTDAIAYFNSILQAGAAYRISHFTCVPASKYQQTLENQTSLKFGRYTKFENIPAEEYQKHYFNFTAYNQLGSRLNQQADPLSQNQTTLTDYIGCLTRVGDVERFGRPGGNQYVLRKLDIENLSGDVIELTLWDETAENFQKAEYESMQKPVIIAVSSCKVTEYAHNLQLTATSATFYYLNPEIPELGDLIAEFTAKYDLKPLLEISKTRYKDLEKEKTRNRFPISTLLQENPDTYRAVRFTAEATIIRINTARDCSAEGTLLLEMPDTHSPSTPVAAIPIRQIPLPFPPSTIKEATTLTSQEVIVSPVSTDETTTMGDVHETHETKSDRATTLKRALFSTEPEEQKKTKSDQEK